jgi:hypothetical protein
VRSHTEVIAQDEFIAFEFGRAAGKADLPLVHDVVTVTDREGRRQILLHQEDSETLLLEAREHLDDLLPRNFINVTCGPGRSFEVTRYFSN